MRIEFNQAESSNCQVNDDSRCVLCSWQSAFQMQVWRRRRAKFVFLATLNIHSVFGCVPCQWCEHLVNLAIGLLETKSNVNKHIWPVSSEASPTWPDHMRPMSCLCWIPVYYPQTSRNVSESHKSQQLTSVCVSRQKLIAKAKHSSHPSPLQSHIVTGKLTRPFIPQLLFLHKCTHQSHVRLLQSSFIPQNVKQGEHTNGI